MGVRSLVRDVAGKVPIKRRIHLQAGPIHVVEGYRQLYQLRRGQERRLPDGYGS